MATSRVEGDPHLGFGRGSAVREYWLMRCQGFSAMRADGRRLGRVKRIDTHIGGSFLRLTGLRARTVPLSAVDTVWPGASVLIISNERACDRPEDRVGPRRADRRPAWTEDTVPWWELVDGEAVGASNHVKAASPRVRPRSARLALDASRMRTLALFRTRLQPFVKAFAARATSLVGRAQSLARTLARKAVRASRTTCRALESAWMVTQNAVRASSRRIRVRVARLLVRIAVWVGGSNEFAVDACRDSRLQVGELDTEEMDLGSGPT
jgi:hypothetical protein